MEIIKDIQEEIRFVGGLYKNQNYIVWYERYIKLKYDFEDEATKFFYEQAIQIYKTRTQTFNKVDVVSYMAEDKSRYAEFRRNGGWDLIEKWIRIAPSDDDSFKKCFQQLKKYSVLREYQRQGFDIEKIKSHKRFNILTANDVCRLIRSKADKIRSEIIDDNDSEILNSHTQETVLKCLERPDKGDPYPFAEWNDMFRGARMGIMMLLGMLSNAGKSRILCKIVAYMALVNNKNVLVLLNEMSALEFRYALITTVINNPEFEELHGVHLTKKEREITLGVYHDRKGNVLERHENPDGTYSESFDDFVKRLQEQSDEFVKVQKITKWIDKESVGKIIVKDIQSDYSEESVQFEIKKAVIVNNIHFCAYDTLKPDKTTIGSWDEFKRTATMLAELAKELKINLTATFQLTDDAALLDPLDFTTNQIASSKQIFHVADEVVVFAEVRKENYNKYVYHMYNSEWGEVVNMSLNEKKRYYICNTLKNRAGNKKKLLFDINLDTNTWFCEGEVSRRR